LARIDAGVHFTVSLESIYNAIYCIRRRALATTVQLMNHRQHPWPAARRPSGFSRDNNSPAFGNDCGVFAFEQILL
jgi:hypothetical protein